MKKTINAWLPGLFCAFFLFICLGAWLAYEPARNIGKNFLDYGLDILGILPCVLILSGLFEVWVKKETVEKHLGRGAGPGAYLWVLLLGGCTIGPLLVALPVAVSLYKKGATLSVVFTYIGAAGVCRIPMTLFEISYLGLPFTLVRYSVSIPAIIISSVILGRYLERAGK